MRHVILCLMLMISACAPQYVGSIAASEEELPVRRALFDAPPKVLNDAFRAGCQAPGDEFRAISRDVEQCLVPPSPDLAAFLVLGFDGALEVPRLIIQKRALSAPEGVLVEISYFAEVIQKSGNPRRIYFKQARLDALMDQLLRNAGGITQ